ncbi:uncharacterized protein LOC113325106 [Papaver somniferum]|uniref:uncharacterized protein LOC113325106 n=1 Tax=Papaver somniferum TaxID=3469 RepID=UPI000E6F6ECF|nr:uncharacterized protein LOC113325106 [Papaver somniferum]
MGKMGRNRGHSADFKYDSISYALNFDEGVSDDTHPDYYQFHMRNFSSRLPASPPDTPSAKTSSILILQFLFPLERSLPIVREHLKKLKEETNNDNLLSQRQQKEFPDWFKNQLRANSYSACNLNGIRYHTKQREARRTTQNSGLVVDSVFESIGTLYDVIEVEYLKNYRVVLFKCDWFDLTPRKKNLKTDHDLTCLNVSSTWYKNDPYVIASDARQVFYLDDHKFGADWKVVLKMHHIHIWDVPEMDDDDEEGEEDVYQQTGDVTISSVIQEDNNVGLDELHRDDVEAELVDAEIVHADDIDVDDIDVEEEDETLVDYNDSEVEEEDIEPVDDDTDLED